MGFEFDMPPVAGVVLVRSAIQSPNYVVNVSGWTINQDGSAEFNNVAVRGTLYVGGINGSYLNATSQNGIPVIAFNPGTTDPAFLYSPGSIYSIAVEVPGTHYSSINIVAPVSSLSSTNGTTISVVSATGEGTLAGHVRITGDAGTAEAFYLDVEGRIQVAGNDIGGGWIAGDGLTAVQTAVNGTETVQMMAKTAAGGTPTFQPGLVYRVESSVPVLAANTATQPQFRIRKTNTAGQQLDAFVGACPTTTFLGNAKYTSYFQVDATAVTASIVLSIMGSAANSVQIRAFPTSPASFNIYEDGLASSRPWAATLV